MARCSITGTLPTLLLIAGNVFRSQSPRHREVDLNGTTLPDPAKTVPSEKLNLGAIESAFARQQFPVHALAVKRLFKGLFRLVPALVGTDALSWAGRELCSGSP